MATTLTNALNRCLAPAEQAFSLPPAAFAAPEAQALEAGGIFARGWVPLGRADRVTAPGDFEALEIAGRSLILLRDPQGQLRAHANTCRHRGARLVEGCGNTKGIRCPFHAWAYKLDEDIPALENQQRGLASPDARQGRFSPELEPNAAAFARWYAGRMLDGA